MASWYENDDDGTQLQFSCGFLELQSGFLFAYSLGDGILALV